MKRTLPGVLAVVALGALVGAGGYVAGRFRSAPPGLLETRGSPGVVLAIRDVARLETTEFHVEKVIEVSDPQSKLWGLVTAKDALLLVAVANVVAGVDLSKVHDEDVRVEAGPRAVRVRLPAPQIFASTLDSKATHVYARSTDALATRNESLEADARRLAEEQMREAAIDAGILDRAREAADRTLRALLRSLGYEDVELDWTDKG